MPGREGEGAAPLVQLRGLSKSFGSTVAVDRFSLDVPRGSFTTLLGPSGCGKTTALRMVAGFVEPDSGSVLIGGADQTGRPPNLRGVGMVFQDYALFPHMTVEANVEYGLRMQRVERAARRERVARALELLGLTRLAGRYPHQLSGGQQQRVALGRVVVLEPEVLLMDEPLSNLDAKLRVRLRAELRELQRQLGITTLYVTHDQEEALSLSDQLVVMSEGQVQQVDSPQAVYARPVNRFVAEFVGLANMLPASVQDVSDAAVTVLAAGRSLTARLPDARKPKVGDAGTVMVRPEQVVLAPAGTSPPGDAWLAHAVVASHGFFGAFERYWLEVAGVSELWLVDVPAGDGLGRPQMPSDDSAPANRSAPVVGSDVTLAVRPGAATWVW